MSYSFKQTDFLPIMSQEQIDKRRIKAILSFDEHEVVKRKRRFRYVKYLNRKGEEMIAFILLKRKNGEIIVENLNGVRVCLTEDKLIK